MGHFSLKVEISVKYGKITGWIVINKRKFVQYGSASLIGTVLLSSCQDNDHNQEIDRPNIVVIIADDLRWDCWGMFNKIIQTPNINSLANKLCFTHNF